VESGGCFSRVFRPISYPSNPLHGVAIMITPIWDIIDHSDELNVLDDPDYPFEVIYNGEGVEFFSTEEDAERAINLQRNALKIYAPANTDNFYHRSA
jgi:hypothetical protein